MPAISHRPETPAEDQLDPPEYSSLGTLALSRWAEAAGADRRPTSRHLCRLSAGDSLSVADSGVGVSLGPCVATEWALASLTSAYWSRQRQTLVDHGSGAAFRSTPSPQSVHAIAA
jgi:hypothetical protein